ncbi:MAG: type I-E CRISPR-associated protein Cse1/CasA [Terriglobia bacterium]
MDYNLLKENWIPVLWKDGNTNRVGVIEALGCAGEIWCIALASPLDLFAVHRFMLTLLYWKADLAGGVERVRESLLKGEKLPSPVLNGISKEARCFDLFDDKSPFLQDPTVRDAEERKSAGSLFSELATGTNIAHFHHGNDENLRLCLPCATLGILRLVPWSQSGGSGLTPSIHNAPPIMALATGDNLAVTLGLNLVPQDIDPGEAKWSGHFKPADSTKPIASLEAFTWNPRRVLLPAPEIGICCYCGQADVLTLGPGIVYLKNADTKANKQNGKGVPFTWRDPSAFYRDDDYKTVKSAREDRAIDNQDLGSLENSKSLVVKTNQAHNRWGLIVPCTNPANNKTFDHRLVQLASLSSAAITGMLHTGQPPTNSQGLNGWDVPRPDNSKGIRLFVQAAMRLPTHGEWGILSNAAYHDMHDFPAAFDVFAGLYWGLRDKKIGGLPSRNVAWLVLKLMAAVPAHARTLRASANFCPLRLLPRRQMNKGERAFRYPITFPAGDRLEAALRWALDRNLRKRKPEPVDWIGLCDGLDQLLE